MSMEARAPGAGPPRRPGVGRPVQGRRFGLVLLLVLSSACFQVAAPDAGWARLVTILFGAVILIAAVWAGRARRLLARAAAAAATLVALAAAVDFAVEGSVPALLAAIANGLLVAFAPMVIAAAIVRNVREEGAVTLPTLSGVLSIYLLVGMFFSFLYAAIQAADDGGFFAQVSDPERSDLLYFSYITLSTTGYGDLTPAADLGRTVAVTEALFGQIYLVTIVALIVANLRPRR
jgi:Ion channel